MTKHHKPAQADLENLHRIFTVAEAPNSTLGKIEADISQNLVGFLQEHIVAVEKDLIELEKDFSQSKIDENPVFVSEQADFLLNKLVAHSVHTASPSFVGHMTSAVPHFMLPLSKIMIALNQNMVKIETSKAFTPLERQVLGMMHRLIYEKTDTFYQQWMHDKVHALGAFCSGGTIANITALWVARNHSFPLDNDFEGIHQEGVYRALQHYNYQGAAILVSQLGHYSLSKAADLLGLGRKDIHSIPTDTQGKINILKLKEKCETLKQKNYKIVAIVGVAGTSETGNVDPLEKLAEVAKEYQAFFHVDAAWGGPTLFSKRYRKILKGIELADSVTIDAHKQLYVPMGAGIVVFRNPHYAQSIEHHAQYIIRKGSKDLGSHTLEGSRPGMAMLVQSGLKIIGRRGYEILVELGIDKAKRFANMIIQETHFELVTKPELNILTYRYLPNKIKQLLLKSNPEKRKHINETMNKVIRLIQKTQRAQGKFFVSRTRLNVPHYDNQPIVVFRVVLANPLTTDEILRNILENQKQLSCQEMISNLIQSLLQTENTNQNSKNSIK